MSGQWLKERVGLVGSGSVLSWTDLSELVKVAQTELGVVPDGKPGKATLQALGARLGNAASPAAIPKNRAEAKRVYGDPSWTKLPRGRSVDLNDEWEAKNIAWFVTHTGKRVRLHRLVGDEFVRLFKEACEVSGYTPKSVQTFNPRVIGGTKRLSTHALGVAFDVDPRDNPWGGKRKDGSLSLLRQHPAFYAVFERAGWTWGGRWKHPTTKERGWGDDMHFQRMGVG